MIYGPSRRRSYFSWKPRRPVLTGIVFDSASNSGCKVATATYSWSHTVDGFLSNRILIVGVSMMSLTSVTSITFNGVALSQVRADTGSTTKTEIWRLINPNAGTYTIEVTLSTSVDSVAGAVSFGGVDQTNPIDAQNGATGTADPATVNVTTVTDGAWVIDTVVSPDTTITIGAGQIQRWNLGCTLGAGAGSTEGPKSPAGSVTMSWTDIGALSSWAISAIAIKPLSLAVQILLALSDDLIVRDGFFKLLGMNQQDTQASSESFNKLLSKNTMDTIDAQDMLSKQLRKIVDEIQHVSDNVISSLLRFVLAADSALVNDAFAKVLAKSIADDQSTADAFSRLLVKLSGDNLDITDISNAFRLAVRQFIDSVEVGDAMQKLLAKTLGDPVGTSDARSTMLSKAISDRQDIFDTAITTTFAVGLILLAISDALALSDDHRKALFKNIGEIEGFADTPISMLAKSLTERQDFSDTVSINQIVGLILLAIADSLQISDQFSKSLVKNVAENDVMSDGFVKAISKSVGETVDARDEFAKAFAKVIGDRQDAADAFALALVKVLSDNPSITDAQSRMFRKVLADIADITDAASLTKITQLVVMELLEVQDVRDDFVKSLFKVLGETQSVSDAVTSRIVELLAKFFIDSMVAAGEDLLGKSAGAKVGIRMFAGDDDPLDILTGAKGRRLK